MAFSARPENSVAQPLRILLVDDNPAVLKVVTHMLRKDFVIAGSVLDPSAVQQEVSNLRPDVVILDISIGELNGLEVTRRLRADQCPSKIIFLTVHEELEFIRAAFDAGASGYVFKSRLSPDLRIAIEAVQEGKVFIPEAPIPQ